MQRLFSTFPCGPPGAGLLILRAVVAVPLSYAGGLSLASPEPAIAELVAGGAALLLFIGLWTPIAGAVIAAAEFGVALSHPEAPWTSVHFGLLGAALALLGPGGCSVDARLFGRRRIQIPRR